jgi:ATP-dependent RNA helicase RhlE
MRETSTTFRPPSGGKAGNDILAQIIIHNKGASMNFESFHLHSHIQSGIKDLRYTVPTSIQVQCIPPILRGRDVIGLAQTGTGKTAAFVLPILQHLMAGSRKPVRALIMAPTRELAEQIHQAVGQLGRYTRLRSVAIYGGVNKNPQIRKLHEGAEISVACPGRLIDLMDQGVISLSQVEVLVLDEADRMFDMGFLPDVRKIIRQVPVQRQTLLFSATMPDSIRSLAKEILRNPVTVQIGENMPVSTVSHAVYPVEQHLKTALLVKLLRRTVTGSVLIFTRTKHRATRLSTQMKQAGFAATSLQGDLSQQNREKALSGFRNGTYRILVATDIAARGIDVSGISHVINYDMPDTVDAYTHRIGRTGRAARTGEAFSFMTRSESTFLLSIESILGEKLETRKLKDFDYALPAPQGNSTFRRSRSSEGRGNFPKVANQPLVQRSTISSPAVQPVSKLSSGSRNLFISSGPRVHRNHRAG